MWRSYPLHCCLITARCVPLYVEPSSVPQSKSVSSPIKNSTCTSFSCWLIKDRSNIPRNHHCWNKQITFTRIVSLLLIEHRVIRESISDERHSDCLPR